MRRRILLGFLLGMLCSNFAGAAEEMRAAREVSLLILPFEIASKKGDFSGLDKGIPDLIAAYIGSQTNQIRLIEREKLDALIREKSLSWQSFTETNAMEKLGRLIQANFLLKGSLATTDETHLVISALLYEIETARLLKSFEASGTQGEFESACQKIAAQINDYFASSQASAPTFPADEDPEKSGHLIEGMGNFYRALYAKAAPAFLKILEKHPNDALAKYWLGRTFYAAGLKENARIEFEQFIALYPQNLKAEEVKKYLADIVGTMKEGLKT